MQARKNKQDKDGQQGRVNTKTFQDMTFQQFNEGALQSACRTGDPEQLPVDTGKLMLFQPFNHVGHSPCKENIINTE